MGKRVVIVGGVAAGMKTAACAGWMPKQRLSCWNADRN